MKITGGSNYIKFDLENGYVLKANGEMLVGNKFAVYRDSMKFWEAPRQNEEITEAQIIDIIEKVKRNTSNGTVQILFD